MIIKQFITTFLCLFASSIFYPSLILGQSNDHETIFFTPKGFQQPGKPKEASGSSLSILRIEVRDQDTGQLTPCRINVVGSDGNFYQPTNRYTSQFDMTGIWPQNGAWGNRPGKAPYRYLGHFFYSQGTEEIKVPTGKVWVEIWKGFEYRPERIEVEATTNRPQEVKAILVRVLPMSQHGYFGGDPHLHFPRTDDRQQDSIFQLLEAEDVWYGTPLGYNEPAGPYTGLMEKMASPQSQLGKESLLTRGNYSILSGQEYRSAHFGHLNLYLLSKLVFEGENMHLDDGPPYGVVGSNAIAAGGYAIHAHGGYSKEIYADAALGAISAVELLQFGIYRELGLSGWYDMLNSGYRFPCVGASDFPACRFMSDCRTYVKPKGYDSNSERKKLPSFPEWMEGISQGRSFVTTGPMLLFRVDDSEPGDLLKQSAPSQSHRVQFRVRSEVAKIDHVDLIVSGKVVKQWNVPSELQLATWFDGEASIEVQDSCWVAARAWSEAKPGLPDAEAHTNPIYIDVKGKRTYHQASIDRWIEKIDGQIAFHTKRTFKQKANVLDYFQKARDALLRIRSRSGLSSDEIPWELVRTESPKPALTIDSLADREWTDEEFKQFLQPVPPLSPEQALRSFDIAEGFKIDLVAAEPLVCDPVAATIDEQGQLYVCEMRDYPYKPKADGTPLGTIRLLRDPDGDGSFDEAHLFADKLLWPAGIVPWKGGVFVAAPPNIWYLKDTDGDHRADLQRKIFSGFGTENQQAMVNNLQFGLDQWIYGTTAGNGGTIITVGSKDTPPLVLNGRDFRFDPRTERIEAVTGTVQFGNSFDDWGNRFTCSESQPLLHVLQPDHYLARNPFLAASRGIHNLAPGPVPIYRISPVERWRQVRSSRRIAKSERSAESPGASHHVIDAAAGVTVYRGDAFPPEFQGQVFVGDGQNNLVHRRLLEPEGVTFRSKRADEKSEFLRSSDIWFRPVNFVNAHDGTLYCLDMYREILESIHIPLDVAKHLQFANGRERGRIYRIAPKGFLATQPPNLANVPSTQLTQYLLSKNAWHRETAQRLLIERNAVEVVKELLNLIKSEVDGQSKIHALSILSQFGQLDPKTLAISLRDSHPRVREHAIRLSEPFLRSDHSEIFHLVRDLAMDPDPRIRYQLAFSIGESPNSEVPSILKQLVSSSANDPWMNTAILSSASGHAVDILQDIVQITGKNPTAMESSLLQWIGARNQPGELARVFKILKEKRWKSELDGSVDPFLIELAKGMRSMGLTLPDSIKKDPWVQIQFSSSKQLAIDSNRPEADRLAAVLMLGWINDESAQHFLIDLLSPEIAERIQIGAIRSLSSSRSEHVCQETILRWPSLTPEVRRAAAEWFLMTSARTKAFLRAASSRKISFNDLDPLNREHLLLHRDPQIRKESETIIALSNESRSRKETIARYQAALTQEGDIARGKIVFEKNCASCHQVSGVGYAIGPNLASSTLSDPRTTLVHILDPNLYVLPNYLQYTLLDQQGQIFSGQIVSQNDLSVTLRKDRDNSITILRSEIVELKSTGKSMMPEELEKVITIDAMSDLLAFLRAAATKGTLESSAVRDFGTLPGLIEP